MTDASMYVDDAAKWASELERREFRGPGDTIEAAHHRAELKYGIPASVFWRMRYRKPKTILVDLYFRLRAAYEAECDRQEARLRHEIEITKALGQKAADSDAVAQAEALIREGLAARYPKKGE